MQFNLISRSPNSAQPFTKPARLPKYTNTHVQYNYTPQNKNRRGKCEYSPTPNVSTLQPKIKCS